jgi:hypothetical protein
MNPCGIEQFSRPAQSRADAPMTAVRFAICNGPSDAGRDGPHLFRPATTSEDREQWLNNDRDHTEVAEIANLRIVCSGLAPLSLVIARAIPVVTILFAIEVNT